MNTKYNAGWIAKLGLFEIDTLDNITENFENSIDLQLNDLQEQFDFETQNLSKAEIDEVSDFYFDDKWVIENSAPNRIRAMMFVAYYSLLEEKLVQICKRIEESKFSGKVAGKLFTAVRFLQKKFNISLINPDDSSDPINLFNNIRNKIVHEGLDWDFSQDALLTNYLTKTKAISRNTIGTNDYSIKLVEEISSFSRSYLKEVEFQLNEYYAK